MTAGGSSRVTAAGESGMTAGAARPRRDAADEWLAVEFARRAAGWAAARGADKAAVDAVHRAARAVSLATSGGHVCLPLADVVAAMPGEQTVATLRPALLDSLLVGAAAEPGAFPLILDADDRLYLHRYFDYERRLAARLMRAAAAPPLPVGAAARARLDEIFTGAGRGGRRADWQKIGVALALRRRFAVISGGPGTGKTTAVVNLLACLLAETPDCRVALAAPTGKAAARMTEAIRLRAIHLPDDVRSLLPQESSTIHRLLGAVPYSGRNRHHAGNPLPIDALVVDEASMLDLSLAVHLLEAVPEEARIILLGDKDQLAAVESGAVFAEISANPELSEACRSDLAELCGVPARLIAPAAPARPSPLVDSAVWFSENYRFAADSGIGRLAAGINAAQADDTLAWLRHGDDSVRWIEDSGDAPGEATWQAICEGYAPYFDCVRRDGDDPAAVEAAFAAFRVLCATTQGWRGVAGINEQLERLARHEMAPHAGDDAKSGWYPGRPVIVLRNDYVIKLFNGDIGIALPEADGRLTVRFPTGDGEFRAISPARLPEHQSAFAMTIHKSQGSEFDEILVLLPAEHNRVVTRELLYTGVTRARHRVTLSSGGDCLATGIATSTQRNSGLLARLEEGSARAEKSRKPSATRRPPRSRPAT